MRGKRKPPTPQPGYASIWYRPDRGDTLEIRHVTAPDDAAFHGVILKVNYGSIPKEKRK